MINPAVANVNKTQHYVAIILDDVSKLGVQVHRSEIERAVQLMKCGNTNDNHYFLKQGVAQS